MSDPIKGLPSTPQVTPQTQVNTATTPQASPVTPQNTAPAPTDVGPTDASVANSRLGQAWEGVASSDPQAAAAQRPLLAPAQNPNLQADVNAALDTFRRSPQFQMDPRQMPVLSQKLTEYLRSNPQLANDPQAAEAFLQNVRRGVLGLNQPLDDFARGVQQVYAKNDIPVDPERLVLDSSATRGAPSRPEKGTTFRPDGNPNSSNPMERPSDLDVAYRAPDDEFRDLATRRMQELQRPGEPAVRADGKKMPAAKAAVPQEYPLRDPASAVPEGAQVRVGENGERVLRLRNIEDLAAAARDSDAYVAAHPEEFAGGKARPLSSPARQLAASFEEGLLRADNLPGPRNAQYQPPKGARVAELEGLTKQAGREVSISAVREGGRWDPEASGRQAFRLNQGAGDPVPAARPGAAPEGAPPPVDAPDVAAPRAAGAPEAPAAAEGAAPRAAGAPEGGAPGAPAEGALAKTLRVGGGVLSVGGGLLQGVHGVDELRNGQVGDGLVDTGGGALNTVGGGALLAGGTTATAVVAPIAFGVAASADGIRDVAHSVSIDRNGVHIKDGERAAVGGTKTLGGGIMIAAGVAAASGVGLPLAAGIALVGGAVYAGAAVYQHRKAIGEAVSSAASTVTTAASNVASAVSDTASSAVSSVGSAARGAASWVKSWF